MVEGRPIVYRNGKPAAPSISIFDPIVGRGDGCFEAFCSYRGRPFGLAEHLERLTRSAEAMGIPLPPVLLIGEWARRAAAEQGDGIVRIYASPGTEEDGPGLYVMALPLPEFPADYRLLPVAAPWHPGGAAWELAGVKSLSYAPNMAAARAAEAAGFDDALLISREGMVLEGPTLSVMWAVDGVIETPSLDLGILASVTRRVALSHAREHSIEVREGRFPLERLAEASEAAVLSSVREVRPVTAVGDMAFEPGPVTAFLAQCYQTEVEELLRS